MAAADGYPAGNPANSYMLDAATGRELWEYTSGSENYSMAISDDSKYVVGGSDDGKVYFWRNY